MQSSSSAFATLQLSNAHSKAASYTKHNSHFQQCYCSRNLSTILNLNDTAKQCKHDIENIDENDLSSEKLILHYDSIKHKLEIVANQNHAEAQYLLAKLMLSSIVKPISEAETSHSPLQSTNAKEVIQEIKTLQKSVIKTRQLKNKERVKSLKTNTTTPQKDDGVSTNTNMNEINNSTYSISSRTKDAIVWLQKAVNQNHGMSMCLLAETLLISIKNPIDMEEVISLYHRAVEYTESRIIALTKLGDIYFHGNELGGIESDLPKSFHYFLCAAQPQHQATPNSNSCVTNHLQFDRSSAEAFTTLLTPSSIELDELNNHEVMNMARIVKDLEQSEQRSYIHDFVHQEDEKKLQLSTSSSSSSSMNVSLESAQACFWVGYCYATGDNGCYEINPKLAVYYLSVAALLGHPKANYHLATIYRSGLKYCKTGMKEAEVVGSDDDVVDDLVIDKKNEYVKINSTNIVLNHDDHDNDKNEIIINNYLFKYYLLKSIYNGDEDAIFCLADIKLNGFENQLSEINEYNHDNISLFFEKNVKQAMVLFAKASSLGHVDSMLNLAAIHYHGVGGMVQDKQKAFEIYNIAAETGSKDAWLNLASMYHLGDGIEKSEATAREIMRVIFGR